MLAFDDWVMIDLGGRAVQRPCSSRGDLRRVQRELDLGDDEAGCVARVLSSGRPADATGGEARVNETPWKSTGLSAPAAGLILVVSVGLIVLALLVAQGPV